MKVILPDNIFTRILSSCLPEVYKSKVTFLPSSQITQSIERDNSSLGLIPVMDLLKHKDLYVSGKFGISFEGSLCNTYIYFNKKSLTNLSLAGDVSSQEVILAKILFKETYGSDIEIEIITDLKKADTKNLLIIGDENFIGEKFITGISFSEIFVDTFSFPFVNYVFASSDKNMLEKLIENLAGTELLIYDKFESADFDNQFTAATKEYIRSNISSFIFKFDEQDKEGIEQILRLPYFHGIVKDIIEVNFI